MSRSTPTRSRSPQRVLCGLCNIGDNSLSLRHVHIAGGVRLCFATGRPLRQCVVCWRHVCVSDVWNRRRGDRLERAIACTDCYDAVLRVPPTHEPPFRLLPSPMQRWQSAAEAAQAADASTSSSPPSRLAIRLCRHPRCRFPVHKDPSVSEEYCCMRCEWSFVADRTVTPEHGRFCEGDYTRDWPWNAMTVWPLRQRCCNPRCDFLASSNAGTAGPCRYCCPQCRDGSEQNLLALTGGSTGKHGDDGGEMVPAGHAQTVTFSARPGSLARQRLAQLRNRGDGYGHAGHNTWCERTPFA